jgi:hypothetical protein
MDSNTRQALAELLLLAPYVDSHLSVVEDQALEQAMISIGWNPRKPEDLCLGTAFALVREAGSCEIKTEAFMRERTTLVKAAGESARAFEWLGRILGSDGTSGDENRFLQRAKSQLF